jgi:NADH dehydrogenase [ubiquinone] 1 alpha subcomplex assembly factor 7
MGGMGLKPSPPMTPLAAYIGQIIAREGPISVACYMAACLGHPEHGYYMTRDPLGRAGDFTTAPEISQIFGELLGAWTAALWQALGRPAPFHLMELGPGRGTLMMDALKVLKAQPGLMEALAVHLVEMSPVLRAAQRHTLAAAGVPIAWHGNVAEALAAAPGPTVVLANEFFDALPIHQLVMTPQGWRERLVAMDDEGGLVFTVDHKPTVLEALIAPALRLAPPDSVAEVAPAALSIMGDLATHVMAHGGAALIIDYGHAVPGLGDTLQAVRNHQYAPVLEAPGEADLTAHVDFAALQAAARSKRAYTAGPVGQGPFLNALGAAVRADRLKAANPAQAADIQAAYDRLTGADAMGTLFKVLAIGQPNLPLPGFPA